MYTPHFLILFSDSQLSEIERVVFGSVRTLVTQLLRFAVGRHRKLNEIPDMAKRILAGLNRVEQHLQVDQKDALAKQYSDFFTITQFVQSSYRASQGNFLERLLVLNDRAKRIALNVRPKDLKAYLESPQDFWYDSLGLLPKQRVKQLQVMKILETLSFSSSKFADAKIDLVHYNEADHRLIIAEQRSRTDTGGTTAAQSNFEKANLFINEIGLWVDQRNPDFEDFLNVLRSKGIREIHFLAGILFAANGEWATLKLDNQAKAKQNELYKIEINAQSIVDRHRGILKFVDRSDLHFTLHIVQPVFLEVKVITCYGFDYLSNLYQTTVTEEDFLESVEPCISDDLWISYKLAVQERDILALYETNHIEKFIEFLRSQEGRQFVRRWAEIRLGLPSISSNNRSALFDRIATLVRDIVQAYLLDYSGWNATTHISRDLIEQVDYLHKVVWIILIADQQRIIKL